MTGKQFIYDNVLVDENRQTVTFVYKLETDDKMFTFSEKLKFPVEIPDNPTVDRVLRALHLALGISYYKACIPPRINHAYTLSSDEADFWNTVFLHGLGEFMHKNKIRPEQLAKFKVQIGTVNPATDDLVTWKETALLGIGGGKDSIVAGELLKEVGINVVGFVLATGEHQGLAQSVADTMNVKLLGVERTLDPLLLEVNALPGVYNGHVPISLIFALCGSLLAIARGDSYVIVANEASASIPQVISESGPVNHQWSKSIEFERMFQSYVHSYITPRLTYFSAVRPLTSIAVAKIFSNYPQYFEVFTSDNSHFKINREERDHPRWSSTSPKTLSSYILLAPWIDRSQMVTAFGKNYLEEKELFELLVSLLGEGSTPVLDCVGTPDELRASLSLLALDTRYAGTELIIRAKDAGYLIEDPKANIRTAFELQDHVIPDGIRDDVLHAMKEKL
jgi:hypothetical protein